MNKLLLTLFTVFSLSFLKAQHYTQSMPFDTVLLSTSYNGPSAGCTQTYPFNIQLDPSLYNYVSGMQFMIVFDAVAGSFGTSQGAVHAGDTIKLDAAHSSCYALSSYTCAFRIIVAGTPQTAGQSYPCELEIQICTCFCTNIIINKSQLNTATCTVDLANSITENRKEKLFTVYPNPANDNIFVDASANYKQLRLYDLFGKLVFEKNAGSNTLVDVSGLQKGMYTLQLIDDNNQVVSDKIAITR